MRPLSFMVKGLGSFAAILFAAAGSLVAQQIDPPAAVQRIPADPSAVRTLLESTNPRDQAWGAWVAQRDRRNEFAPLLQDVATRNLDSWDMESAAALDSALDALIQLGVATDPGWALSVYNQRPVRAVILLSMSRSSSADAWLTVAEHERGLVWQVAVNALVRAKSPGSAALLLRHLRLTGVICVEASANVSCGTGTGGIDMSCCDIAAGQAQGLPPPAWYQLTDGSPGDTLFSTGVAPVFYHRQVSMSGTGAFPDLSGPAATADGTRRLRALAALLNVPQSQLPVHVPETKTITDHSESAISAARETMRQGILDRYRQLLDWLVQARLLTADEARSLPPPLVEVAVS